MHRHTSQRSGQSCSAQPLGKSGTEKKGKTRKTEKETYNFCTNLDKCGEQFKCLSVSLSGGKDEVLPTRPDQI